MTTTLVVVPDYLSHYLPLSGWAHAREQEGVEVVVATGRQLRARVEADGRRWVELTMARGSNAGVRPVDQADDDLGPFVAATRRGMTAVLQVQADDRANDLWWEPEAVAAATVTLVDGVGPDDVVVDHLAVAARVGLAAVGIPITTFVPGHPSQLPTGEEVYGYPAAWPAWVRPDEADLRRLRATCRLVSDTVAQRATRVAAGLRADAPAVDDVFGALGASVVYRYPAWLADPDRVLAPDHRFEPGHVRPPEDDASVAAWIADGSPYVFASLGTFLGARKDVLATIVAAVRQRGERLALATGPTAPESLGPLPAEWLVAPYLPQIQLIAGASAVISHGGNNTVSEALAAGRRLVVLPLSTDQFAIAADLDRTGAGRSLDPNAGAPAALAEVLS